VKRILALFFFPALLFGQGSQLPKYKVATLPSAAAQPKYVVQVIDGAAAADCTVGGGLYNVLCAPHGSAWQSVNGASPGVLSINSATGAFTFTGAGVTCTSTTCTFSGVGTGISSIAWALPSWLAASPATLSASGTQTFAAATGQTSHQVIGTCGTATSVGLCSLVGADLPTALQNGTTGTTQTAGDNTTYLATDAFVTTAVAGITDVLSVQVRQTVSTGPVSTSGLPTLFPGTSSSLSLATQNVSSTVPLVANAAQGYNASGAVNYAFMATSNVTWSSLSASNVNYLYINASNGATGHTTIQPLYQFGGTPAVTSGQFTFNISQMTGYLGNGTAAVATPIVFVGEAVAGASTITSTVAYAYNGMYTSPLQAIPSSSSSLSLNHNLGISPQGYTSVCTYVNVTSNLVYSAGEELSCDTVTNNNTSFAYMQMDNSSRLLTELSSQSSGFASIIPKGGGSTSSATAADWNVRLYVRRNF
jgi:hypothetical protein